MLPANQSSNLTLPTAIIGTKNHDAFDWDAHYDSVCSLSIPQHPSALLCGETSPPTKNHDVFNWDAHYDSVCSLSIPQHCCVVKLVHHLLLVRFRHKPQATSHKPTCQWDAPSVNLPSKITGTGSCVRHTSYGMRSKLGSCPAASLL
jgi:hypothetical protein